MDKGRRQMDKISSKYDHTSIKDWKSYALIFRLILWSIFDIANETIEFEDDFWRTVVALWVSFSTHIELLQSGIGRESYDKNIETDAKWTVTERLDATYLAPRPSDADYFQ